MPQLSEKSSQHRLEQMLGQAPGISGPRKGEEKASLGGTLQ